MTKLKKLSVMLMFGIVFSTSIALVGCGGLSDDQVAQLKALRAEVSSLQADVNGLKDQKATLERQVGETNAKLEKCAKDKEVIKKNLEKLPK